MPNAATKSAGTIRDDIDAIKGDLAQARSDFSGLIRDLMEAGKAEGSDAKARIESMIHGRLDQIGEGIAAAQRSGKQRVEDLQDKIEERPLTSVAVAFGVGLLLGNIFGRR